MKGLSSLLEASDSSFGVNDSFVDDTALANACVGDGKDILRWRCCDGKDIIDCNDRAGENADIGEHSNSPKIDTILYRFILISCGVSVYSPIHYNYISHQHQSRE